MLEAVTALEGISTMDLVGVVGLIGGMVGTGFGLKQYIDMKRLEKHNRAVEEHNREMEEHNRDMEKQTRLITEPLKSSENAFSVDDLK